jgi:preprotein translocase subunit SecG
MEFLYASLIVIHVLICLSLIIVVLLQSAKGEGLAGAFGGGGLSGAVFGGRGAATFLSKATSILAICFMVSSLTLAGVSIYIRGGGSTSGVIENLKSNTSQPISTPSSTLPGETQQGTSTPPAATPGDSGK